MTWIQIDPVDQMRIAAPIQFGFGMQAALFRNPARGEIFGANHRNQSGHSEPFMRQLKAGACRFRGITHSLTIPPDVICQLHFVVSVYLLANQATVANHLTTALEHHCP